MGLSLIIVAGAYLMGAIPFSYFIALAKGVDLRRVGSGNIGATNVARNLGKRLGLLALLLDMLKGYVPVVGAKVLFPEAEGGATIWASTMVAAVIGHMFPVTFLFRGGKGVATALGTFFATCPLAALSGVGAYIGFYIRFRISSLGSIALMAITPVVMILLRVPIEILIATLAIGALVLIKHHSNIQRLIHGEESKV